MKILILIFWLGGLTGGREGGFGWFEAAVSLFLRFLFEADGFHSGCVHLGFAFLRFEPNFEVLGAAFQHGFVLFLRHLEALEPQEISKCFIVSTQMGCVVAAVGFKLLTRVRFGYSQMEPGILEALSAVAQPGVGAYALDEVDFGGGCGFPFSMVSGEVGVVLGLRFAGHDGQGARGNLAGKSVAGVVAR